MGFLVRHPAARRPKPRSKAKWGLGDRYTANVRPVTAEEEPQVHMVFAVPGMPASDPQRTALSVMTHVLGGGMSSRLFQTVRERNGLCYSIYSHHAGFDDTGLFAIATATRPKDAAQGDEPCVQGVPQDRRETRRGGRARGREVGDGRRVCCAQPRRRWRARASTAAAGARASHSRRRTTAPRRS